MWREAVENESKRNVRESKEGEGEIHRTTGGNKDMHRYHMSDDD